MNDWQKVEVTRYDENDVHWYGGHYLSAALVLEEGKWLIQGSLLCFGCSSRVGKEPGLHIFLLSTC